MKKIILSTIILIATSFFHVFAQSTPSQATDNVTLNIKLYPIHTLTVNNAANHKNVDLEYKNTNDYANGVTARKEDHLSVYSTGGFEIRVKSAGTQLNATKSGAQSTIDASTVTVTALEGSAKAEQATYFTSTLSATEGTIVSANQGGVDRKFTVDYKGAGAEAYLNKYIKDENPTVYTTTVTYTIVAK